MWNSFLQKAYAMPIEEGLVHGQILTLSNC